VWEGGGGNGGGGWWLGDLRHRLTDRSKVGFKCVDFGAVPADISYFFLMPLGRLIFPYKYDFCCNIFVFFLGGGKMRTTS
jgi:hypothetical protein